MTAGGELELGGGKSGINPTFKSDGLRRLYDHEYLVIIGTKSDCSFTPVLYIMDFLRSAVTSAISKGPPFPYIFGDRLDLDQSIWTLFNGTKRVGTPNIHNHSIGMSPS